MTDMIEMTEHPSDRLPEYVRGAVPDGTDIERHLAECADCRDEVEILRALADSPVQAMSLSERERAYAALASARPPGPAWMSIAWKVAAAIALLLTGVGVWQVATTAGAAEWNPTVAEEAWETDLADLEPEPGDVILALGYGQDMADSIWEDLDALDPLELVGPWEEQP